GPLGPGLRRARARRRRAPRVDREGGAPAHLEPPPRTDLLPPPGDQDAQVRGRPPPGRPRCARGVRALDPCRHLADARHGRRASLRTPRASRPRAPRRPSAPIDRRRRYARWTDFGERGGSARPPHLDLDRYPTFVSQFLAI